MNKLCYFFLLCVIMLSSTTCKNNIQSNEFRDEKLVKFWESFETEMRNNNVDFLTQNSNFIIQCGNCGIEPDSIEWFNADVFFKTHIEKILPPLNKEYSISHDSKHVLEKKDEKLHRINYSMKAIEKYNLIYSIVEKENQYKFQGMFTVP